MKKKDIYEKFFQSFKTVVFQSIVVKREIQYQCFNQVIQKNKTKNEEIINSMVQSSIATMHH